MTSQKTGQLHPSWQAVIGNELEKPYMQELRNFLKEEKAAFAKNLIFDQSTIKIRPDIHYHNLGLNGVFQGSTYFTPRFGLSSTTYSTASTALITVVSGNVNAAAVMAAIKTGKGKAVLTMVSGGKLTASIDNGKVKLTDENGGTSFVTATDLKGSNGVVHVIDSVVLPK